MNTTTTTQLNQLINKAEALGYQIRNEYGYYVTPLLPRWSYTAEVHKAFRGPWGVEVAGYGLVTSETVDQVIDGLKRAKELVELLNEAGI